MRRGRQPLVAAVLALTRAARCPDEPWLDCGAAPPPPPPPVAPPGGDLLPAAADPLLLPRTAATLDGHSATTDEALNAAGAAGNHTSHFVAFRCKHSMGYLQRSAHPVLGTKVDVTPYSDKELLPPREAIWRLAQAPGGLSVLEALDGHHLLTMHGRLRTPPWMLFVVPPAAGMDATSTPDDLTFRVELDERTLKDDRERRADGRLYAVGAGAYVNCVDGKHLRGHSGGANRRKAATREPSTLLEIWTLSAAQARRAEAFREAYAPPPKKILQKPKSPLGLFSKPLAPRPAKKKGAGSPTEEAPVGAREFYIKWAGRSHHHCSWVEEEALKAMAAVKLRYFLKVREMSAAGAVSAEEARCMARGGERLEEMVQPDWLKVERVENIDYSKWLGPDWKPQWKGAGTLVSNHVSWLDIVMAYGYFFPAFVSKRSVEQLPGVKTIMAAIDGLFVDRAGTVEEK